MNSAITRFLLQSSQLTSHYNIFRTASYQAVSVNYVTAGVRPYVIVYIFFSFELYPSSLNSFIKLIMPRAI
jgi:hypothetical protein